MTKSSWNLQSRPEVILFHEPKCGLSLCPQQIPSLPFHSRLTSLAHLTAHSTVLSTHGFSKMVFM